MPPVKKRQSSRKNPETNAGTTLTEEAYRTLKWAILRGDLLEGTFLSETEVASRYGISHTPFREACNRLHYEELLEVVPRRGYLVSKIGFSYVRDLFEMRQLVEGMIAEVAALRADDSQIDELAAIVQNACNGTNGKAMEVEQLITANREFHLALAGMTQNAELVKLVRQVLERSERIAYIEYRCIRFHWGDFSATHLPIVEALRRRDAASAREAVLRDITDAQISTLGYGSARKPLDLKTSGSTASVCLPLEEVVSKK